LISLVCKPGGVGAAATRSPRRSVGTDFADGAGVTRDVNVHTSGLKFR
jgi:hypothetical protein